MTTARELANELGAHERTMRRAVRAGTIRCRRPTPRTLILSGAERTYLRRHWRLLAQLREALRTEPNVRLAVLFGSLARGDERPDSDADFVVELRNHSAVKVSRLRQRLEGILAREVEFTYLKDARSSPLLMAELTREGRVLVDRDRRWPRVTRARDRILREARKAERELFAAEREAIDYFRQEASV